MRSAAWCLLLTILAIGPALQPLHAADKMVYAGRAASKFVNFPGLPACTTGSVESCVIERRKPAAHPADAPAQHLL